MLLLVCHHELEGRIPPGHIACEHTKEGKQTSKQNANHRRNQPASVSPSGKISPCVGEKEPRKETADDRPYDEKEWTDVGSVALGRCWTPNAHRRQNATVVEPDCQRSQKRSKQRDADQQDNEEEQNQVVDSTYRPLDSVQFLHFCQFLMPCPSIATAIHVLTFFQKIT